MSFGVYVHWPFCLSKCPYCDFNSHAAENVDQARWRDALMADLRHVKDAAAGETVTSVFFGGGTPSLMAPETAGALIEAVRRDFACAPDLEITLEANPSTVEAETFPAFRDAGVNRVSLGVQSFHDGALRFLGRRHSADEARRAVERAAAVFERFSFDLICARPGQTADAWRAELADALALAGGHLSVYQLTIESGTAFYRHGVTAADENTAANLFEITREVLEGAGLPAYEISNHARPGDECRHNLAYWRGGGYAGVGPGAHGRLYDPDGVTATHQVHNPARWLELVESQGHGTAKRRRLSRKDRIMERVMMGLRLTEGIDKARFQSQTGVALRDALDAGTWAAALDAGYLEETPPALRATAAGRRVLDGLAARLLGF